MMKLRKHRLIGLPVIALCGALFLGSVACCADSSKQTAEIPSSQEGPTVATVGQPAPDFTLRDTEGQEHRLSDYLAAGKTVVLEWFNPDCPFIKKHHEAHKTMNELYAAVKDRDVVWLAINSGAPGKQGHGLERNRLAIQEYEMPFAVLLDEQGEVGRQYQAKTTPHMFVIAEDGTLLYTGAIDDNSGRELGQTNYVQEVLNQLLAGQKVTIESNAPYGCSVKYAS